MAEKLEKFYSIDIFQNQYFKLKNENKVENKTTIKIKKIIRLPFMRYNFIRKINSILLKKISLRKLQDYDYIFLLHPLQYSSVNKKKHQKLIYDCMDDHVAMCLNTKMREEILVLEKKVIIDANLVVFSSEYLKKIILKRYNIDSINSIVLNNGINIYKEVDISNEKKYFEKNNFKKIVYIGTISNWFDIELILKILKKFDKIEIHVFGPCEIKLPNHPRLKIRGLLEHKEVNEVMNQSDALIMPFILNEIVLSVNPVKAYEYISAKKPIFLVNYGETKKFEEYCYLYNSFSEIEVLIKKLIDNNLKFKGIEKNVESFLLSNTWEARVENLIKEIKKI
ncbi:MAG: hypothetical protein ACRC4T_22715 [Cetobacterium sp.]